MKGPFLSVDTMMITMTMQRMEAIKQTGVTSLWGDCSAGNSTCFSGGQAISSSPS